MENKTKEMLNEFRPQLERPGTKTIIWMTFLSLLIILGLYALYLQITKGHAITGMRDNVVWGIYIVNFIFFMGISYAGALICLLYTSPSPRDRTRSRMPS